MSKKMKYYSITHGHILATWQIIFLTSKYDNLTPEKAINISLSSGKLGGTFPAKQGMKICLDYGFVVIKKGVLKITEATEKEIIPTCNDEEPNIPALRKVLSQIISFHNFEWLIYYDPDPIIFKTYLETHDLEWVNLLQNAKLFDFSNRGVNDWWDNVLTKYEDYKEKLKKAIGDVGEKLTYKHELKRIHSDGYTPAKSYVKWASRISDKFGFDVLSIRGVFYCSSHEQKEKIQIEVKSSDTANIERFRFFVSKPEWNKALENIDSYFFYCWAGINVNEETSIQGPFVIPAKNIASHFPKDTSEICSWSECRLVLDVSKYNVL